MSTHKTRHARHNRKAQVLTADFIMGITIFVFIIMISTTLWNMVYNRNVWLEDANEMQNRAFYITESLINSPGIPEDWNSSTVAFLGLRESGSDMLDSRKLTELNFMSYEDVRSLMGLGKYEYYLNVSSAYGEQFRLTGPIHGRTAVLASKTYDNLGILMLENYTTEWDYYWPEASAPASNANETYTDNNEKAIFKMLIDNLSSYETIIFEGLQNNNIYGDVDPVLAKEKLKEFVYNGGTIIDINDAGNPAEPQLISYIPTIINPQGTIAPDTDGTVINNDVLLARADIGDAIEFESKKFKFDISEVTKPIVKSVDTTGDYCIVCMWEYGQGKVYYMPDIGDNTGNPVSGLDFDGLEVTFGEVDLSNAKNIIPVRRIVMIQNEGYIVPGILNFYIYN